ncbi:prohibitin family protein [Shewanella sp. 202IG2-18]|uniref:prohibitin family protein n=1 Tax=Parashewanella hymeniacidonis TaxID=2807618 RepID=UPI0019603EB3|nr:prohibitin family protein [Parashewanella hymeniacidonis]MBM7073694.1 prohibitin family protein [Parashewanella hymeniacidonis]
MNTTKKFSASIILKALPVLIIIIAIFQSFYTVSEGHVGVVKRFGEAKHQENPGLHFKIPFIETVEFIEVRTRKNAERMASSTKEQMPVTIEVSVNWTVNKDAALDLFKKYGGLSQFEQRILDPRFRSAAKDTIPQFEAEQLIQDRASAIQGIERRLTEEMAGFPVVVDNIQIENIVLPKKYINSIEIKQTEKNLAAAEEHKLERQRLEALRAVNTADAKAKGILKVAEAEAQSILLKGRAEAKAIEAKAKALKNNPLIVKLTEAQGWDGKLPSTVLGNSAMPIMDMRSLEAKK